MAPFAGYNLVFDLTGDPVSMTDETCSVISGTSNRTWEIDDSAKNVFDWATTFTVEVKDSAASNTFVALNDDEYDLYYVIGRVRINNYTSESGNVSNITDVRVTGSYLPRYRAINARAASMDLSDEELGADTYQDAARRRLKGQRDVSSDFETLEREEIPLDGSGGSEDTYEDVFMSRDRLIVLSWDIDGTGNFRVRSIVRFMSESLDSPVDGLSTKGFSATASKPTPAQAATQDTKIIRVAK